MPPNLFKVSANTPQARQSQTCLSFAERSKCSSEINRGKNKTNSCVFLSRCCLTYLKYKFLRRVIAWKATPEKPGTWKRSGHMPGKERKEGRCLEGTTYKYFRRYCLPGRQLSLFVSGHIHSLRSCMYPISEVLPSRQIITTWCRIYYLTLRFAEWRIITNKNLERNSFMKCRRVGIPADQGFRTNHFNREHQDTFLAVRNDGPPTMRSSYLNTLLASPLPS